MTCVIFDHKISIMKLYTNLQLVIMQTNTEHGHIMKSFIFIINHIVTMYDKKITRYET